jgi:hypothetical protein
MHHVMLAFHVAVSRGSSALAATLGIYYCVYIPRAIHHDDDHTSTEMTHVNNTVLLRGASEKQGSRT